MENQPAQPPAPAPNADPPAPVPSINFMSSIAEECNELKKAYDDCFNAWFSEKFLKGDKNLSRCDALLNLYTGCVKNAIKTKSIDVTEVEKEHLGTEREKKRPTS